MSTTGCGQLCCHHQVEIKICYSPCTATILHITERNNRLHSFHYKLFEHTDRIENTASNSSYTVECEFVAAGKCLQSGCLATKDGTHKHTDSKTIIQISFYFLNKKSRLKMDHLFEAVN
jgi:hypothetical protein